jgi:hypothetical protein
MADEIVEPFLVKYEGKDTERNIIEADAFGQSIAGGARFYNAVTHYCVFAFVPKRKYKRSFACYASPAKPGSVDQWLFIAPLVAGEFAIHAALYRAALSYIFRKVCDGVLSIWRRWTAPNPLAFRIVGACVSETHERPVWTGKMEWLGEC